MVHSRFYVDADIKYFAKHLQNQERGKAYLRLYRQVVSIEELIKSAYAQKDAPSLRKLRREYIIVTNYAAAALAQLEHHDHWPP